MDRKQFYEIFNKHIEELRLSGFAKKSYNTFLNAAGIQLKIVLNKWGWDDENGWGFLVRLSDLNSIEKHDSIDFITVEKDIIPDTLIENDLITRSELSKIYEELNKPKVLEQLNNGWFSFYDPQNLDKVLTELVPLIAEASSKWSTDRVKKGHPSTKRKKIRAEVWAKTKKDLDDLFKG